MKILKFINKEKLKKNLLIVLIFVSGLYAFVFCYSIVFEKEKLAIDNYNFKQLNIVKKVLNTADKKPYEFNNLKEFNEKFKQNITPIKNCYFLSNKKFYFKSSNGKGQYIFGFKLESLMYKFLYFGQYYAYPKYNLVYSRICYGVCDDRNKIKFKYTITNPCED